MTRQRGLKIFQILILGVLYNCVGRYVGVFTSFPGYLNVAGTIYSAYYGDPIIAAMVALISSLINAAIFQIDIYYLVSNICFALAVFFVCKDNKFLNRGLSVFSLSLFFALVETVLIIPVEIIEFKGRTQIFLADSVMDFLNSMGAPIFAQILTGTLYVCFADCFISTFFIYFIRRGIKFYHKKKNARRLKKVLGGRATLGLMALSILLSFALPLKSYARTGIYFVEKSYDSTNGLVGGCANDVVQTQDGSMWVGTYGGLYRFNGKDFQLVDIFDTVRSVQCLYADDKDRLWVGTNGAGVTMVNDGLNSINIDEDKGLPSNVVREITQDKNGKFYFGTTNGLSIGRVYDDQILIDRTFNGIGDILSLASDSFGTVAALNTVGKIAIYTDSTQFSYITIEDAGATCVVFDDKGNLYVGTDMEFMYKYVKTEAGFELEKTIETPGLHNINDIYFHSSGIAYIASDSGIGYMDEAGKCYLINNGAFDNSVESVYEDYQGDIWFTSYRRGLLCLSISSFEDLFGICNQPSTVANATLLDDGLLYVGTDDGLRILDYKNGYSVNNDITEFFTGSRVRCLSKDLDGNILIAAYGKNLMAISKDGELFDYIDEASDKQIDDRKIRLVKCMPDGTVITSSESGLTFIKDHEITQVMELGEDLENANVLNIISGSDGNLLAGTDGDGIAIIKDGKLEKYINKKNGLSSGVILRIVEDKIGNGYFVMTGSGMCYLNMDYTVKEIKGVPYYNNFDIYQSHDRNVFIMGGAGIYIIKYENLMAGKTENVYTLLDLKAGLPGSLTSNAWNSVDEDFNLYLCGSTGVYTLNTLKYGMEVTEYKAKITGLQLDGNNNDVTSMGDIIIPTGTTRATFTLDLNNFTPTDPYVRYYLSGVDNTKTKVLSSELGPISYFLIPYGTHQFHIEVVNEDNKVLTEQVYTIIKEPEVYETKVFRVYFLSTLGLIFITTIISFINGAVFTISKRQNEEHDVIVRKLQSEKTEALERALHMEEDANKTKSAFLANMSHEIRTPINAIIGMGTMIARESHEENTKKYARDIRNASKTLLALINDILDFSKIESGNFNLVLGKYDLSIMINDLINMMEPRARDKKLAFEVNINQDIPENLYGDEVRIEQIIINILSNAIKYTYEGTVTFVMDYEPVSLEEIKLKVSISDTGIGIKEDEIEKLFSPYRRIDEQKNKKVEGTGLGMSITKSLLEKMGSKLSVNSVYGEGSTFSFEILQTVNGDERIGDYRKKAEASSPEDAKERYHAADAKVLVVDDVEMNLIVAKNLLKRIKIKVDTASSGLDAIKLCQETKYDIIFLDAMMPELSGVETLENIRQTCQINDDTPIIVLTANAVKGAKEEYLEAGFNNYLSKPIDGLKLEAMIEEYLPEEKKTPPQEDEDVEEENAIVFEDELIHAFTGIPEIDVFKGIDTAGALDTYKIVCQSFYDTATERMELIKDYFIMRDIKNYTIQVHALKSSARLIGALDLSERALELEMAGKEENLEIINANTDTVLTIYNSIYKQMGEYFERIKSDEEDNRELISEEQLEEAYEAIKELVPQMEYDGLQMLMEEIDAYKLPKEDEERFKELRKALKTYNWDKMEELIK